MVVVVVMGVAGSGKTTVGARLAERLGARFVEGDALHPPENVAKMARGEPLGDVDRAPWYAAIAAALRRARDEPGTLVLSCSALRRSGRDLLREAAGDVRLLFLRGEQELVRARLESRQGHFFGAELLDSQLEDLEPPAEDECPIVADLSEPPEAIVEAAARALEDR